MIPDIAEPPRQASLALKCFEVIVHMLYRLWHLYNGQNRLVERLSACRKWETNRVLPIPSPFEHLHFCLLFASSDFWFADLTLVGFLH